MGGSSYLRCKIESEVAVIGQRVLNKQWHLIRQAQLDRAGQTTCFAEVDQILEGESQGDRLCQVNFYVQLGLVNIGVLTEVD